MSVTLKQYLKAYQSARQLASPTSTSTLHGDTGQQLEREFNQKVKDLKRNLRRYLDDEEAFSLFESEIDQLFRLFHQNSNLFSVSKISKGLNEKGSKMSSHTRLSRSKRKSKKIITPRISLEDQMIDIDENMTKGGQKKLRVETEPTQIYYKTVSSIPNSEQQIANFQNHPPEITPSPYMLHTIHAYGYKQATSIQQQQKLRSSLKAQKSNENLNNWYNNKEKLMVSHPPKLDKKNSYDGEDLQGIHRRNIISLENQNFI